MSVALVLAALAIASPVTASAETSAGPRLGYELVGQNGATDEFVTVAPGGGDLQTLASFRTGAKADLITGFSWSPDGSSFAYASAELGPPFRAISKDLRIYVEPVGGGPATEVPDSAAAESAIFSPDGSSLAVLRLRPGRRPIHGKHRRARPESSIWLLSLDGVGPRQLTPWRSWDSEIPGSFEPDGTALAVIRTVAFGRPGHRRSRSEALSVRLDGSGATRIAPRVDEIAYSPDGTRIAVIRPGKHGGELWVGAADGTGLRPISEGPRPESSPAWDPSGQRIAFVMLGYTFPPSPYTVVGFGNTLNEINADGSCLTVFPPESDVAHHSPSWQPGTGRNAGPIVC
jgi:Tol biopolymer transport system component